MKVVLQDIVREIAKTTKLALPDARVVTRKIVSTLIQGIMEGQRIEIRGLGSFRTIVVKGKKGRDIMRNFPMTIPDYRKVSFKAGKGWKRDLSTPAEQPHAMAQNGQLEMSILGELAAK